MKNKRFWAVVPIKNLSRAKTRLAPVLAPGQRREFFENMIKDVFNALGKAPSLAGVMVITGDPWACELAEKHAFRVLQEPANRGQTAAIAMAAQQLCAENIGAMMTVPGDVPLITAQEVECLIAAHGPPPAVTIAPALDELGSNAVLCSPPDVMPLRFGENSFFPHLQNARNLNIAPAIVRLPGFGLDIDRPADLLAFAARASATNAFAYLERSGLRTWILQSNPAITETD